MSRKIDLIIYGCTGFSGRLAVQYMASNYGDDSKVNWAIAGRNRDKIEQLKSSLINKSSSFANLDCYVVDCNDKMGLVDMVKATKVVISFAGPYALYGTNLINACANNGTHYADLTGELPWVKQMISQCDQAAVVNHSRIIPTCGFDSVPSDLAVYHIVKHIKENFNEECLRAKGVLVDIKSGFSGGSIASGINIFETMAEEMIVLKNDPVYMLPDDAKHTRDRSDQTWYEWDEDFNSWTSPFVMSPINSRIVRWSNHLYNYGSQFTYSEAKIDKGKCAAVGGSLFTKFADSVVRTPSLRSLLKKFGPAPGEGPSEKTLQTGYFQTKYFGISQESHKRVQCNVKCDRDPGYVATAQMLCEAGLCLALNEIKGPYGFVTSAVLGKDYISRLENAGIMNFEISICNE